MASSREWRWVLKIQVCWLTCTVWDAIANEVTESSLSYPSAFNLSLLWHWSAEPSFHVCGLLIFPLLVNSKTFMYSSFALSETVVRALLGRWCCCGPENAQYCSDFCYRITCIMFWSPCIDLEKVPSSPVCGLKEIFSL